MADVCSGHSNCSSQTISTGETIFHLKKCGDTECCMALVTFIDEAKTGQVKFKNKQDRGKNEQSTKTKSCNLKASHQSIHIEKITGS